MPVAIAYLRVSSGKQVAAGTDANQIPQIEATAKRLGAKLVAVYADKGISAKSGNLRARGDFARLVADLPATKPDLCIVGNIDRLTRTELFAELGAIWGPLQEHGVKIATSGGQVLDLATPEGQLLAMFESWRAARENAARSERTKAGRLRAAREGRNPGRAPYGYACVDRKWSAPHADIVRELFEASAAGRSCSVIAGELNRRGVKAAGGRRFTASGVKDIIQHRENRFNGDPYVTGLWIGQKGEAAIQVPKIVDADLAARARAAMASRSKSPPPRIRYFHFLDMGAMRCKLCGGNVVIAQSRGRLRKDGTRARFAYYVCEKRLHKVAHGESCPLPLRRVEVLDAAVWRMACAWAEGADPVRRVALLDGDTREQAQVDLEDSRAKLAADNARLDALAEALGSGAISAESYRTQIERVKARRDLLAQQVATWEAAANQGGPAEVTPGALAALRMEIRAAEAKADQAAKRALIRRVWPRWIADEKGVAPVAAAAPVAAPVRDALRRSV